MSDLMSRVCRRDPLAFAEIYDGHAETVYRLFAYIVRDSHTAEDLVQELFLRLWNRSELFDAQRGSLGGWLMSMARNMAIDHLRASRRRRSYRVESIDSLHIRKYLPHVDPADCVANLGVSVAFVTLRDCEKAVLELAYFHGYSQREIAALLGRPLGTVKTWTRSGLDRLRSRIAATPKAA